MVANLRHFAIECDDVERARAFYEAALGWRVSPWGPPGFYQVFTGSADSPGVQGALQERREPLEGTGNRGVEPTYDVDDLEAFSARVPGAGGVRLMDPFEITGVGRLAFFADTEGNRFGLMQYEADLRWPEEVSGSR